FASLSARKKARRKQGEDDGKPDQDRVPLREGVLWVRRCRGRALQLRRELRLQKRLPLRRRVHLQGREVARWRRGAPGVSDPRNSGALQCLQVQSRQPCSAQVPQVRTTCLRNASRARKTRTPALLAVIPASAANSCTDTPSTSTRRSAAAYSGFKVSESRATQRHTAFRVSRSGSTCSSISRARAESARSLAPPRRW